MSLADLSAGFVESGERSKQRAMRQAVNKGGRRMAQRTNRSVFFCYRNACWFSLMVAREQERVAGGRFCRNMDLYL
jgi:hypothetical protein